MDSILAGIISGVFSAGVVVATLRIYTRRVDKVEERLDAHIDDHAKGLL